MSNPNSDPVVTKIFQSARMWTIAVCMLTALFLVAIGLQSFIVFLFVASVWFSWHQFQVFMQFSIGFGALNRLDELVRDRISKEDLEKVAPLRPQCRRILAFPIPDPVFSYVRSQFNGIAVVLVLGIVTPLVVTDGSNGFLSAICLIFGTVYTISSVLLLAFWLFSNASFHFWRIPRWHYDQRTQNFRILAATDREKIWDTLSEEGLTR